MRMETTIVCVRERQKTRRVSTYMFWKRKMGS